MLRAIRVSRDGWLFSRDCVQCQRGANHCGGGNAILCVLGFIDVKPFLSITPILCQLLSHCRWQVASVHKISGARPVKMILMLYQAGSMFRLLQALAECSQL